MAFREYVIQEKNSMSFPTIDKWLWGVKSLPLTSQFPFRCSESKISWRAEILLRRLVPFKLLYQNVRLPAYNLAIIYSTGSHLDK